MIYVIKCLSWSNLFKKFGLEKRCASNLQTGILSSSPIKQGECTMVNSKKVLFFCFILERSRWFWVSILISSWFLCFYPTTFATPFTTYYAERLYPVEEQIVQVFRLNDDASQTPAQKQYMTWLSNLHSSNDIVFVKELKELFGQIVCNGLPAGISTDLYFFITNTLGNILGEIKNAPMLRLKEKVTQYFRDYFGERFEDIEFFEKPGGIQLGQKARITLRDSPHTIDYYIKTHRGGLLSPTQSSGSVGPRPVDPKELFVYKVFELIGCAPETHFFFGEGGAMDCYIATKDAGFNELTGEQRGFLTYSGLSDHLMTNSLGKKILTIYASWQQNLERTLVEAEMLERDLQIIERNIIKELSKVDILARAFLLTDLTTNSGNTGFILDEALSELRVIDFVLSDSGTYEIPDVFDGFLSGNGKHRYFSSVDNIVRYVLYARHQTKRVQTAKEIIQELTATGILNDKTIDAASDYVKARISVCLGFEGQDESLRDLDEYVAGIKFNLRRFREAISLWYTDDQIQRILEHYLPEERGFIVIPPAATVLIAEETELILRNTTKVAIRNGLSGQITVMPLLIRCNHWVGVVFRPQVDGTIQVIHNDPLGISIEMRLIKIFQEVAREMDITLNIVDLQFRQQQNTVDCGPFTVDNLVRIARSITVLDSLNATDILHRVALRLPLNDDSTAIRNEHNALFMTELPPQPAAETTADDEVDESSTATVFDSNQFALGYNTTSDSPNPQTGFDPTIANFLLSGSGSLLSYDHHLK